MNKTLSAFSAIDSQGLRRCYKKPQVKFLEVVEDGCLCDASGNIDAPDIPGDGDLAKDGNDGYEQFNPWED